MAKITKIWINHKGESNMKYEVEGSKQQMKEHRGKTFISSKMLNEEQTEILHSAIMKMCGRVNRITAIATARRWVPPFVSVSGRGIYISFTHGTPDMYDLVKWNDIFTKEEAAQICSMFAEVCFEHDNEKCKWFSIKVNDDIWIKVRSAVGI